MPLYSDRGTPDPTRTHGLPAGFPARPVSVRQAAVHMVQMSAGSVFILCVPKLKHMLNCFVVHYRRTSGKR